MDIRNLEAWLGELSPFEKNLKEWYEKHGELMPEAVFLQKRRNLQQLSRKNQGFFSRLDASCRDYEQVAQCKGSGYANLSPVHWLEEREQFFIQKHPNYFPEMRAKIDKVSILYLLRGRAELLLDAGGKTEKITMVTGDLMLIAPDSIVAKRVADDTSVLIVAGMAGEAFRKSLGESWPQGMLAGFFAGILCQKENNSYLIFHTAADAWICHLFYRAMLEFAVGGAAGSRIVSLTMELIFAYAQKEYGAQTTLSVKGDNNISRIPLFLGYLQEHYPDFSLEEMAAHFHLSTFYVSRSFQKYMGKSIRETLKEIRVSAAEILLRSTEYSVNEIAELVGYQDVSYFIGVFRREKGLTPLQYRKHAGQLEREQRPET